MREPLISGRQSPESLSFALLLSVFLQSLVYYLEYSVAGKMTNFPYRSEILTIHFWVTAVLIILSVIYAIPFIYKRSQRVQYLISILVTQNLVTVSCFILGIFLVGEDSNVAEQSLVTFTKITLFLGVLLFFVTSLRFYILLRKGKYRKGSKREELRGKFEKRSYIPAAIIGSSALVFIIQYMIRTLNMHDFREAFITVICFALYYTLIFILPEQLVILYCKFRFKSFNFNKRGYLESED